MATLWQHICQSLWRLLILISEIQSLTSECFSEFNDLCKTNSRPHKNEIYASEFKHSIQGLIRVKQRRKYSHGKCLNNSIEFYYGILLNCIKGQIVNQRKILNDIYYKRCFMLYCLILFIYLQWIASYHMHLCRQLSSRPKSQIRKKWTYISIQLLNHYAYILLVFHCSELPKKT